MRRDCQALAVAKGLCGVIWLTARRDGVHDLPVVCGETVEGSSPRTVMGELGLTTTGKGMYVCCQSPMQKVCLVRRLKGALQAGSSGLCASAQSAASGRAPECNTPGSAQLQAANQEFCSQVRARVFPESHRSGETEVQQKLCGTGGCQCDATSQGHFKSHAGIQYCSNMSECFRDQSWIGLTP